MSGTHIGWGNGEDNEALVCITKRRWRSCGGPMDHDVVRSNVVVEDLVNDKEINDHANLVTGFNNQGQFGCCPHASSCRNGQVVVLGGGSSQLDWLLYVQLRERERELSYSARSEEHTAELQSQ